MKKSFREMIVNTLIIIFLSSISTFAQNYIAFTQPTQNQVHISKYSPIIIGFTEPILDTTLNDNSVVVYGTLSSRHFGSIFYDSLTNQMTYTPLVSFASGERVFVSLTSEIKNISGVSLAPAYSFGFSVKSDTGFNYMTSVKHTDILSLGTIEDMLTVDLDIDGDFDLVFTSNLGVTASKKIITYINDGQANFQQFFEYELNASPKSLTTGDYNNDGRNDIATVAGDYIEFIRASGNGQLHYFGSIEINNCGMLESGDFNNDGIIDVVGLELEDSSNPPKREVSFIKNLGNGSFEKINSYSFSAASNQDHLYTNYYSDIADLNNDGFIDIVISIVFSNRVYALINSGEGIFSLGTIKYINNPFSLSAGDFDNDSDVDLAISTDAGGFDGLQIYQNMGNTVFLYFYSFYLHSNPWDSFCTDFNNDGKMDIATIYGVGHRIGVYFGNGNLSFENRYEVGLNPSSNPYLMDYADFDGDGDVDIVVLNDGSIGRKLYFLQNGPSTSSVDQGQISQNYFSLSQNYPNPFNPVTKIKFTIPRVETRQASSLKMVTLKVYDLLGREVTTLVNEEKPAGEYEVDFNATNIPSGIYFYQLKAGSYSETRKMVLLK